MSNLRNREKVAERLAAWDPFNDCFPRSGVRISDLDGAVEIGEQILIIESKPYTYDWTRQRGQRRLLECLARHGLCVWILYSDDPVNWAGPLAAELLGPIRWEGKVGKGRHETTLGEMQGRVRYWAKWADASPWCKPDSVWPRPEDVAAKQRRCRMSYSPFRNINRSVTPRQAEVLRLISEGVERARIAQRLDLKSTDVHSHLVALEKRRLIDWDEGRTPTLTDAGRRFLEDGT